MTNRGLSERDWAIMYLAWLNELPLSDTIWRYEANERRAALGHDGSCTKQPGCCAVCLLEECLDGGRMIAETWEVRAAKEDDEA